MKPMSNILQEWAIDPITFKNNIVGNPDLERAYDLFKDDKEFMKIQVMPKGMVPDRSEWIFMFSLPKL